MTSRAPSLRALAMVGLVACSLLSGCRLMRAAGKASGSLFASPRKVEHKLKDPIDKNARLAVLWVGHATTLVQIDDKVILTDPVFTSTVGQLSKRVVEPGLDVENLPPIDAVLISHMHFDHLSLGTLAEIEPKVRTLLMPRQGATYLTDFRFPNVELRPWQAWEKDGLRVTAVPVDHVGYRYGLDDAWMTESFTGYVIEYHGMKVYFPGDTAYDQKLFAETAQRFPGIDVALLPIGPIQPRDIMRRLHVDPAEALQAFFDLGAKHMVPIHYDTFVNSTDEPGDAVRELNAAMKRWDLEGRDVATLAIGERRIFLRKGEGPQAPAEKGNDKAKDSWSTPAAAPASTAKPAEKKPVEKKPPPKNEIPDEDRLD
jgi:N-acyl-phosphatidylethanolamine-hydrolysing phospholipase D